MFVTIFTFPFAFVHTNTTCLVMWTVSALISVAFFVCTSVYFDSVHTEKTVCCWASSHCLPVNVSTDTFIHHFALCLVEQSCVAFQHCRAFIRHCHKNTFHYDSWFWRTILSQVISYAEAINLCIICDLLAHDCDKFIAMSMHLYFFVQCVAKEIKRPPRHCLGSWGNAGLHGWWYRVQGFGLGLIF